MEPNKINKIKDMLDETAMGSVPLVVEDTDLQYLEASDFIPKKRVVYSIWIK